MGGKEIYWFGAGLSRTAPTTLPSGPELTWAWLDHLLPMADATFFRNLFQNHHQLMGRSVPRLEKIIEDAQSILGDGVLALLDIFRDVPPNIHHHLLAQYLTRTHGWAVTTNFDAAVEQASGQNSGDTHLIQIPSSTDNHHPQKKHPVGDSLSVSHDAPLLEPPLLQVLPFV